MNVKLQDLRSTKNPKVRIKIMQGHFVRCNSHVNTYIDLSTIKCRCVHAMEAAKELAEPYLSSTEIDTIVCLDGMEVVGAFLAEILSSPGNIVKNRGKEISIITPELNQFGQMMFRDNTKRMVEGKKTLILAGSLNTGKTMVQAVNSVDYYGGDVVGICAVFSAARKVAGMNIHALFTQKNVPDYQVYLPHDCPLCKEGRKIDAIVNNYGYSAL
ncbi:MAG: orotate phosphoribosyltransferase [Schaedlerella sp.]|nr:orotate phosphoribosyltransferase [Schaedlerella sp.]